MKPNSVATYFSAVGHWVSKALLCALAIAFVWQGAFVSQNVALAYPENLMAAADTASQAKGKAREDAGRTKTLLKIQKMPLNKLRRKTPAELRMQPMATTV